MYEFSTLCLYDCTAYYNIDTLYILSHRRYILVLYSLDIMYVYCIPPNQRPYIIIYNIILYARVTVVR